MAPGRSVRKGGNHSAAVNKTLDESRFTQHKLLCSYQLAAMQPCDKSLVQVCGLAAFYVARVQREVPAPVTRLLRQQRNIP